MSTYQSDTLPASHPLYNGTFTYTQKSQTSNGKGALGTSYTLADGTTQLDIQNPHTSGNSGNNVTFTVIPDDSAVQYDFSGNYSHPTDKGRTIGGTCTTNPRSTDGVIVSDPWTATEQVR